MQNTYHLGISTTCIHVNFQVLNNLTGILIIPNYQSSIYLVRQLDPGDNKNFSEHK